MSTQLPRLLLAATLLVPLASACANTDDAVALNAKDRELVVAGTKLWSISEVKNLKVCFVRDPDGFVELREEDMRFVQDAVEGAWETIDGTAIDFKGWGECTADASTYDIGIIFKPFQNFGKTFSGTALKTERFPGYGGLKVNMELPVATSDDPAATPVGPVIAKHVAIHEFGHALGLHHEMEHADYDQTCVIENKTVGAQDEQDDDVSLVDVDHDGIMNYCAGQSTVTLTEQDKLFAQLFYPDQIAWYGVACESGCFNGSEVTLREDGVIQDEFTARGAVFQRPVEVEVEGGETVTEIVTDAWFEVDGDGAINWTAVLPDSTSLDLQNVGLGNQLYAEFLEPGSYEIQYHAQVSIDGILPEPDGERRIWGAHNVNISNAKWTSVAMSLL